MKFNKKTALAIAIALFGALGINIAIDDNSPLLAACDEAPAAQPVAGSPSAPSNFAGSLASDEDAGAK